MTKDFDIENLPYDTVGEPVELYELTLEQALETPVILDRNTRASIRVQDFLENDGFQRSAHYISRRVSVSYTGTVATMLMHGLSLFQKEHSDFISEFLSLKEEVMNTKYQMYESSVKYYKSPTVTFGLTCKNVWCDAETHEVISATAMDIGFTSGVVATVCLCMSLAESTTLPERFVKECSEKVQFFNRTCNINLDNLKQLKY